MRRVHLLRQVILELGPPVAGLFLAVYLPITHAFEPWHLPLVGGLIFGNLVAREDLGVLGQMLQSMSSKKDLEP
jgi:hypothetical protein